MQIQIPFFVSATTALQIKQKQVFNENQQKKTFLQFSVKIVGLGSYRLSHVKVQECVIALIVSC